MLMSKKIFLPFWVGVLFLGSIQGSFAQSEQGIVKLTVEELFDLVLANNPSLKVQQANIEVAEQGVKVAKNNYLPNASVSLSAFYLGDINLFSPDLETQFKQDLPNFGNAFGVEVNQLLWKGGQVQETIRLSRIQEEIAHLQYSSSEQQAKLAALGYYLDLYKLINQARVFTINIELANQRLENISAMSKQGMIAPNDLIRAELQISNLRLMKQVVDNNILILNKQLNAAIGLPSDVIVIPDESTNKRRFVLGATQEYKQTAYASNPLLQLTQKSVDIQNSLYKIARKNYYPSLAFFAGNNLNRPVTSGTPVDMYYNAWNAGIALKYDIASLWKNPRVVAQRKFEVSKAEAQKLEAEVMIGVAVDAAIIKHNEAISQNVVLAKNKQLADENYRIMENKYNNQLVIILDLLDASNAKLDAELQFANTEVNIIFAYYKLLKETGKL